MADKEVLKEFTINFDFDFSKVTDSINELKNVIDPIMTELLPQLETLLKDISALNLDIDTTALENTIERIKKGAHITTDEIETLHSDLFDELKAKMADFGLFFDDETSQWTEKAKEELEQIEDEAEETESHLESIFSRVKGFFSDLFSIGGGFGGFALGNAITDWISEVFELQGKKNGVFDDRDLRLAEQYQKSIAKINEFLQQIQKVIARFLLPIFEKLATGITKLIDFIIKHHKTVLLFLGLLGIAFAGILRTQLAILATQLKIFAPYIAVAAIIALIAAVIEDIYFYFMGWDSVTGDLVKRFPALGTALEKIRPIIMAIFSLIDDIIEFFKNPSMEQFNKIFENLGRLLLNIFQMIGDKFIDLLAFSLGGFVDLFSFLGDIVSGLWSGLVDTFKKLFKAVKDYITNIFTEVFNWIGEKINAIMKPIKEIKNAVGGAVDKAKNAVGGAVDKVKGFFGDDNPLRTLPVIPQNTTSSNTINNNAEYNNDFQITLNGVDEKTAKGITDNLSKEINKYQMQVGNKGAK